MEIHQTSTIRKIAEQAKKDLEVIRKAHDFVHNRKFTSIPNAPHYFQISIDYMLWSFLSFSEEAYIEFIETLGEELTKDTLSLNEQKYQAYKSNYEGIEIIDRVDYAIKFISKNLDIAPPEKMKSFERDKVLSIKNARYEWGEDKDSIIREIDLFVNRALMLIGNIEKFSKNDNNSSVEKYKTEWIEKLTQNKHAELLSEMIKFYQINQEKDKVFKLILLKQRLSKLKNEKQLATRPNNELDIALNNITKAILEIMDLI